MIVLNAQHLSKAFGGNTVLSDVSLTLQNGDRIGLVGVNGCGKTTLLRVLCGELNADGGSVSMAKDVKIGYLAQQNHPVPGMTVYDLLRSVFDPVREMEKKLRGLEEKMAQTRDETELRRLGESYQRLNTAFEEAGGYYWQSSIQGVLKGLGFTEEMQHQQTAVLSGGELTRLHLGRLLLQQPDILLLDEPTNHLDLEALSWLETYLAEYRGSVLVVSHDRYFLDHVCNGIVEMAFGVTEQYPGHYTRYLDLRAERWLTRERAYDAQQKEIARQMEIIRKLRAFNREKSIKRAESRVKMLDKIELLDRPEEEKQIFFHFTAARRTGDDVLRVRGLSKRYDGRTVFENVTFDLYRGDRVALIGRNGIGKTTLFRCLIGEEAPDLGAVIEGANLDMGYYDQHQKGLHDAKTILDEVWDEFPRMDQTAVRSALGQFLFTGEDVFQEIRSLSGGEKGRVALTKLMLRKDNLLLLDEPTNHLDMNSREVLEEALDGFEGTIFAISHDRYFINRFANKVMEMTPEGVVLYQGNYDDYLAEKEKLAAPQDAWVQAGMTKTEFRKVRQKENGSKLQKKQLEAALREAEKQVERAEQELKDYEAFLAGPDAYAKPGSAETNAREYQRLQKQLEDAYAAWEQAAEDANG